MLAAALAVVLATALAVVLATVLAVVLAALAELATVLGDQREVVHVEPAIGALVSSWRSRADRTPL